MSNVSIRWTMRTRHLLFGLALTAIAPLLLGFLCFPLAAPKPSGVPTPTPAAIFAPTVSAQVANTTPGAPSNIVTNISFPAGSTLAIGLTFDVPAGWTVTGDAGVTNGSRAGSITGFMTAADPLFYDCATTIPFDPTDIPPTDLKLLEATTNTSVTVSGADANANGTPDVIEDANLNFLPDGVDKYPAFLNIVLPPILSQWGATVKARYFGHTEAAGLSDLYVNIIVAERSDGTHRIIAITNDPTAPPESATSQFCAPMSLTMTLLGASQDNLATVPVEGGQTMYTNPPVSGSYTFSAALVSEFDLDNDGVSNGLDICPATPNATQADADQDYVGDVCETNALPDFDVDGDGVENGYDNCIFVANSATLGPNNQLDSDFDDLGDACDPNVVVPNGPNHYLTCTDPVGIGQTDPGPASCVEDVPLPQPTPTPTPKDPNGDTDGDTIVNSLDPDDDNDGCTDVREQQPKANAAQGGGRNPHVFWDFFDTPNPNANPQRDRRVDIGDILQVVLRFGTNDNNGTAPVNRTTNPLLTPPKTGYHPAYDRTPGGPNTWNLRAPNGSITIEDILFVVFQFGHSCL